MSFEQKNNSTKSSDIYTFVNPDINALSRAIELLNKNKSVTVYFENDLVRNDNFQYTYSLPAGPIEFFTFSRNLSFWKKLFLLVPHLVQNEKVIYGAKKSYKWFFAILSDFIYKNTYHKKATKYHNQSSPLIIPFNSEKLVKGVVFQEYKINISRLFIELLKYFEKNGGIVSFKKYTSQTPVYNKPNLRHFYVFGNKTNHQFNLLLRIKGLKLRVLSEPGSINVFPINAKSKLLPVTEICSVLSSYFMFDCDAVTQKTIQATILPENVKRLVNCIKQPLTCSFSGTHQDDNYELALEKFDLAKQTGIDYQRFKIFFHRYGKNIDTITDLAYNYLQSERNPIKLWELAETDFQKKYEWKF